MPKLSTLLSACVVGLYVIVCLAVCFPAPVKAAVDGYLDGVPVQMPGEPDGDFAMRAVAFSRIEDLKTRYVTPLPQAPLPYDLNPATDPPARSSAVVVDVTSFQPCPGIISYRLTATGAAADGSGVSQQFDALVWDMESERCVDISDVLRDTPTALQQVSRLARMRLIAAAGAAGPEELAAIGQATEPHLGNFQLFALDGDAIVFYFPPENLGVWAAETFAVRIPYLEIVEALDISVGYVTSPLTGGLECAYIRVPGAVPGGVVDDGRPTIALTFDDGPHTEYTRRVLEELSKRRVVATFCPIGIHVRRCPEVLREIVLQGSEIGNHTWSHQILTRLTPDLIAADVEQLQQRVEALTGRRPTFLRPPGGSYNNTVIAAARLPVVCWSVDPKDWQGVDAATVAAHIIEHARDGDIILQHDTHATSYEALNLVLDELIARGFRFVTVSQLLGFGGPDSPQSGVWRSRG